jgi:hypothetical protein
MSSSKSPNLCTRPVVPILSRWPFRNLQLLYLPSLGSVDAQIMKAPALRTVETAISEI